MQHASASGPRKTTQSQHYDQHIAEVGLFRFTDSHFYSNFIYISTHACTCLSLKANSFKQCQMKIRPHFSVHFLSQTLNDFASSLSCPYQVDWQCPQSEKCSRSAAYIRYSRTTPVYAFSASVNRQRNAAQRNANVMCAKRASLMQTTTKRWRLIRAIATVH